MVTYDDQAKKKVESRLANMTTQINNQIRARDALASRSRDPEALYFCGYEMTPDFLKLGDYVFTKYGKEGEVVVIDRESGKFTLKTEEGELVSEGTDRICVLSYGDVQFESLPPTCDDPYGWE